ncbi:MAG: peptidoglycan editing factor PgeF [Erysipelotrichaceae bacterium]|nr:peptidoglycan editing factor PgeF [Erysipelotrichaceae bacterium]
MHLIPWIFNNDEVEAYTVPAYSDNHNNNMSLTNGNYEEVMRNRWEVAKKLGTTLDHMVAQNQIHSVNFKEVTENDGGKGIYDNDDRIPECDAMYTRASNLALWVFHADCCPVLLYDPSQHLIAAIHSGWGGTVKGITTKLLAHLIKNEGCDPHQMYAYIGPTIEKRNFEAMDDIIDQVKCLPFDTSKYYEKTDATHYHLDHKGLILRQLMNAGLKRENIEVSPYCTMEHDDLFFSYRKTKTQNRNISLIRLKK